MAGDGGVVVQEYCGECLHGGSSCPIHGKKHIKRIDITVGPKTDMSMGQIKENPPAVPV